MAKQAEADRLLWQFGAALETFARKEIDGSKRKSVRLFHGQIGFRTNPVSFAVNNDAAALAWTQANLPAERRHDGHQDEDAPPPLCPHCGNDIHPDAARCPFCERAIG